MAKVPLGTFIILALFANKIIIVSFQKQKKNKGEPFDYTAGQP